jgi:glycerol-3-phosphate acyltransferase PlsY
MENLMEYIGSVRVILLGVAGFSYLLGSISSAILVSKVMRLPDPRTIGSGNPGATNVLRGGSKLGALFTLLGDALKGFFPVILVKSVGLGNEAIALALLFSVLGHMYPVFFGFKGGKGVATSFGGILAYRWWLGVVVLVVWGCVFLVSRISSLSALLAAVLGSVVAYFFIPSIVFYSLLVVVIFLVWRHRENIKRLCQGIEGK